MKKKSYLLAVAIALVAGFSSCKNDSDGETELAFSTLSVEKQKQAIEQNGMDLIDKMNDLMNSSTFDAIDNFTTLGNGSYAAPALAKLKEALKANDVEALSSFNQNLINIQKVSKEGSWGTYTWNQNIQDFVFNAGENNKLVVNFPATKASSSNNASFTVIYTNSNVLISKLGDVSDEMNDISTYLPASINATLKINNSTTLECNYAASYDSDAAPLTITQTLKVDDYNWGLNLSNTDKKNVSTTYHLQKGKETLMKVEVGALGSFSKATVQTFIDEEGENAGDLLSSANVYCQILNVAFVGKANDIKGLVNSIKGLSDDLDNKAYADKTVEILNKYTDLYGYFISEKKKFADVEFYTYSYVDPYGEFDYVNYKWIATTVYKVDTRMVLSDGSKVTMDDYVRTGFEDLINKFE